MGIRVRFVKGKRPPYDPPGGGIKTVIEGVAWEKDPPMIPRRGDKVLPLNSEVNDL
jgi:hypothetical protein